MRRSTARLSLTTPLDARALGLISLALLSACSQASGTETTAIDDSAIGEPPTNPGASSPLGFVVPGVIEAEDFDRGGEGVAYHDTTPQNLGGAYRSTAVDIEASTEHGYDIGWIESGEWTQYTFNAVSSGRFDIAVRVASANPGGSSFHLAIDGATVGTLHVADTGGWQNWHTVTVHGVAIADGLHTLRLVADGSLFNVNYFSFAESSSTMGSGSGTGTGSGTGAGTGSGTGSGSGTGHSGSGSGAGDAGPVTGLAAAQKFVSDMQMGVDIERSRITYMTYQGNVIGQSTTYFDYLKQNGVDHVRIFFPWSPSFLNGGPGVPAGQVPPTSGTFDAMLQGALNANKAGVKVFFDLMDLTATSDCQGASLAVVHSWLTAAAQRIKGYGFDPSMIALGPINEPTGASNAEWDPILQDLHDLLRQTLPASDGWILTKGGAYWADPGTFANGGLIFSDPQTVYMVHYYPAATPPHNGDSAVVSEWAGVAKEVLDYAASHGGVPIVLGESGLYNGNDVPYGGAPDPGVSAWPAVLKDTATGAGALRPLPWAVTDGSDPLSNGGSDATLPPAVAAAFKSAAAFIKGQSYYTP